MQEKNADQWELGTISQEGIPEIFFNLKLQTPGCPQIHRKAPFGLF